MLYDSGTGLPQYRSRPGRDSVYRGKGNSGKLGVWEIMQYSLWFCSLFQVRVDGPSITATIFILFYYGNGITFSLMVSVSTMFCHKTFFPLLRFPLVQIFRNIWTTWNLNFRNICSSPEITGPPTLTDFRISELATQNQNQISYNTPKMGGVTTLQVKILHKT